jgi:hypothetical protein
VSDDRLRQMLRDLGRALSAAISDSPQVGRTLRQIREEGYTLYLLVDCKREEAEEERKGGGRRPRGGEPVFRINGEDLSFLKSIGIDPTRRGRRRVG